MLQLGSEEREEAVVALVTKSEHLPTLDLSQVVSVYGSKKLPATGIDCLQCISSHNGFLGTFQLLDLGQNFL